VKPNRFEIDHLARELHLGCIDKLVDSVSNPLLTGNVTDYKLIILELNDASVIIKQAFLSEKIVHLALGHALVTDFISQPINEFFVSHTTHLRGGAGVAA